ncbi:glycosyltransferase involved in cell wall biosynthesis [Marinilabilia salmonicolor]|jgi:glycosyltransferase involved in cell wall biosynthesis|uniref:glycosyltransferase n=1 Tax=Marinilabilia salmonicolor TaxID=989 RepID=UPI000D079F1C|nr:glycosyltransferase [Marinilabilia salmonicolor]PRZ01398.1 glycosyltransferase involved in cell wall biosynthesis [Marinilabilia salmonicolor]
MNNDTKICFFNSVKSWGGGEKWHFDMASMLFSEEVNLFFIANKKSALAEKLKSASIPFYKVLIGNLSFLNIFKLYRLFRIFKKEKTDTLIMNASADIKAAGIAAKMAGVRRIIYRRGSAIPIRNTFLNRFIFKHILTDVIANSEATKKTINQNNPFLFPHAQIKVIYNGLHTDLLPPLPDKVRTSSNEIIIGNAARLAPQKGHELLIEIAVELKKTTSAFKILLAGDGPLREQTEKLIRQNNLQENVVLLGFKSNIYNFMDSIDIFVLTSKWEGFGFVLAEAMLRKKPIVAWNLSSNPELVKHGKNGFLTEPYDIKDFSNYIIDLIRNPQKRSDFGEYGYEYASQNFSINNATKSLREFLNV